MNNNLNQEPSVPSQTPINNYTKEVIETLSLEPEPELPKAVMDFMSNNQETQQQEPNITKPASTNKILKIIIGILCIVIILAFIFFILVMTDNNPFTKKNPTKEQGIVDNDRILENVEVPGPKDK